MIVLWAIINIKVIHDVVAKAVLGEHTSYNMLDKTLIALVTCSNIGRRELLLTTGIARETQINAVCPLVTSHLNLACIDDDYVVTTISIRSKAGFILTSQKFGNLCAKTTKNLVCCINNNPLLLCIVLVD